MTDRTLTDGEPTKAAGSAAWRKIVEEAGERHALSLALHMSEDTGADVSITFRIEGDPSNRYMTISTGTVDLDEDSEAHTVTAEAIV